MSKTGVGWLPSDNPIPVGQGGPNQVLGIDSVGAEQEWKTLRAGANVTVRHTQGQIEISSTTFSGTQTPSGQGGVPTVLHGSSYANGLTISTRVSAELNNATIYEAEFRAKFYAAGS